jgi:EAL domain-containing protein (putative c-di-GMP-specific phosphodiesterase class I)/CheY-like chemotaxis protein
MLLKTLFGDRVISIHSKYQATILVVESEPSVAQRLSALLTDEGYNVIVATLGQEAIQRTTTGIDLIVLDILLADMEGVELCHYLKQSESTRRIPIIVLSGDGRTNERTQCLQLGADDFMSSPFQNEDFLSRIHKFITPPLNRSPFSSRAGRLQELKQILDHRLIEPHFQPIYVLDPPGLLGIEVLSRPQTEGLLKNPEILFETALEFGFYFDLEMLVWQKALDIFRVNGGNQMLFLNCSPRLVENDHFMHVKDLFQRSVVNSSSIFLELTERSAISQQKVFYERLRQYRDLGFRIAVDDVGSGYASLEAIIQTRPEVVKIDRSIVHSLVEDPYKSSIVKFIVSFCREHDIICVAEGVETKDELQILKNLGVKACQGYYFCRPTPQLDVSAFRSVII